MVLITLSGPCGSGKSTLIKMLENNYEFVRTVYKNCNGALLNPNSYESKTDYTVKWFDEIKKHKKQGKKIIFSDRSPFDCVAYLKEKKNTYQREIDTQFQNLEKNGISSCPVMLTAEKEILKNRITNRYTSGNRNMTVYNNEVLNLSFSLNYYKSKMNKYSLIINNSYETPIETYNRLITYLN